MLPQILEGKNRWPIARPLRGGVAPVGFGLVPSPMGGIEIRRPDVPTPREGSDGNSAWDGALDKIADAVEVLELQVLESHSAHTGVVLRAAHLMERALALCNGPFRASRTVHRPIFPILRLPDALVAETLSHLSAVELACIAPVLISLQQL